MRLTHKHKYKADNKRFVFDMKDYRKACQKLGQLEDIEEELGIDLRLLPKLLQIKKNDKLYCDDGEGIVEVEVTDNALLNGNLMVFTRYVKSGLCYTPVLLYRDYGKTWALTKEELE